VPLPAGHQMVDASSVPPNTFFFQVECPDDSAEIAAADIRRVAATALANDGRLLRDVEVPYSWTFAFPTLGPAGQLHNVDPITGPLVWTDTGVTLDVLDTKPTDDLMISAWGQWRFEILSGAAVQAGRLRFLVVEDADGAASSIPIDHFAVHAQSGLTLPFMLMARHRLNKGGKATVHLQKQIALYGPGVGTSTVYVKYSAKLDVLHRRRF
jgi:hypothetical protein